MKITGKLILGLCLLLVGNIWASEKSVDDYLHGAAAKYIQGRMQEASIDVEEAIRKYPNDARLKALANQLKQMKDQQKKDQGGSSSQGGEKNKNQEDKKDSSSQKDSQDKKDQQKQKNQKKDQDKDKGQNKDKDKKPDDQKKNGNQEPQQPEPKDTDKDEGQKAAPAKPGEMSKEDAERLLNSYQDDEKREHQNMQHRQRKPVSVEKDW